MSDVIARSLMVHFVRLPELMHVCTCGLVEREKEGERERGLTLGA